MTCADYRVSSNNHIKRKLLNILIVDDDTEAAENFKTILQFRGHNITIVDDGLRCITRCMGKEQIYDIVFMDYHMEGLDGAKVAEILKEYNESTLIFAYTGDNSEKAIQEFKNAKMDGVIIKPFDIKHIELLMNKIELEELLDKNLFLRKTCKSILIL